MKKCKFCGTDNPDSATICKQCKANEFSNKCNNCGTVFDGVFCTNCGVKAGASEKACPKCGEKYFSAACPACGYTPAREQVPSVAAQAPEAAQQTPPKKKGVFWKVVLWIFFLPIMAIIAIWKAKKLPKVWKIILTVIIAFVTLLYAIGSTQTSEDSATAAVTAAATASPTSAPNTPIPTEEPTPEPTPEATPEPTVDPNMPEIERVLSEIGIPGNAVTFDGEDYNTMYGGLNISIKMIDGAVDRVQCGGYLFYENGKAQKQVPDYLITDEEKLTARRLTKEIINTLLTSPSSAEYPDGWLSPLEGWDMVKQDGVITVKSYVDSQNSFGVLVRTRFEADYDVDGGYMTIVKLTVDGKNIKLS